VPIADADAALACAVPIFKRAESTPAVEAASHASAQVAYKALLKDYVAPALRQLGFKGSGRTFTLQTATNRLLLNFQASMYSSSEAVKFTVNLGVTLVDAGGRLTESRVGAYEHPWMGGSTRIGHTLPVDADHWWTLRASDSVETLAAEVVTSISDYALPAMKARADVMARRASAV
jgi:hypothetical protein